jgi:hypothetical protein
MAQLMVVQAAGKLSLLEVSGNMLVRHFLKTSLKKIDFLHIEKIRISHRLQDKKASGSSPNWRRLCITNLILAPSTASSGRSDLPVLRYAVLVTV